jgi:FAD/FMN-containing dehydrogenase/pimeloyl-ACP methyl ester carboxylesterase
MNAIDRSAASLRSAGDQARARLLAAIPVTERRLRLAGVSTAVLEGGDGPPVVLLHGPGANAAHWMRVIPDLVTTHRVIAPDLPGQGASELADGALDTDRVLAWLGELIERTCPSPPAVLGYALGGGIAARFASGNGDRLSRLVLVDAFGLDRFQPAPEFGTALNDYLAQPSAGRHEELWRLCTLDLGSLRKRIDWEAFASYNVDRASTPSVQLTLGALVEHFGAPAIPAADLAAITVPTTLIWGRHDLATSLSVAETASARYGWPLHVIEDAADDPAIEQPEAFLRALHAALAHVDAGPLAAAGFKGGIVGRGHPGYDELRKVFNGMIDRRPALIARCTDAQDVSAAVKFARDSGLPVSVYGGGHNVTGNAVCDDGVTIDLRPMKGIEIDPHAPTCRAEAGLTWGELDAATQRHGLAVTGGRMSTTGLGGLVLGGGSGWIERKCGYAVDNLLSVEIVTADERIVTASENENPDLFWGTRGGGGNFGVVTSFEFRLHPIGPIVFGGMLMYPASMAAGVLANLRDVMADAPDEVGSGLVLLTAPHEEFVPEPVRGQPVVGMIVCYAGPLEQGEEALRPLREFGPPALDLVGPMPYTAVQRLIDPGYPAGMRNYWTGDFLEGLPDEAIDVLGRFHLSTPSPLTQIILLPGGGASARVPDGTMAIGERQAPFNLHITSLWPDPADDDANIAWTRELSAAMKPFTTGRVYVNFIGDEGQDRVVASFGQEGYARLQALKQRYDPDNLFRSNQNIKPRP